MVVENVQGLVLDGLSARQAANSTKAPAVLFKAVDGAMVRNCQAQAGTGVFIEVRGQGTRDVVLSANDFRLAQTPIVFSDGADPKAVHHGWQ